MTTYSLERFNSQFGGFVRNENCFLRIINIECRLVMKKKSSYSKLLAEMNTVLKKQIQLRLLLNFPRQSKW